MAKTYKKISDTWYPIKKIFKRIGGTWSEVKKLYKNVSGTWQVVHSGAYEYTFTANAQNVDFASLIGATAVANNTDFRITINAGVTISGTVGVAGANNNSDTLVVGNIGTRACRDSAYADGRTINLTYYNNADGNNTQAYYYSMYYTGNGGSGGQGNHAINFAGMTGKQITIINNGTIVGGTGGNGGVGAKNVKTSSSLCGCCQYARACALPGSGGSGGLGVYNPNGNSLSISGNSPVNGGTGVAGGMAWDAAIFNDACS